uniref:MHC class I-like antigen recognition-like domain-containing protein n=1 Tax=Salmo trutta TaxID=8032 RepID=A0A674BUF9_SALTR
MLLTSNVIETDKEIMSFFLLFLWSPTNIAASGDTDFPESTVVGFLDDHQFVYFDSNNKTLVPTTEWMQENAGEYYWELYAVPLINQYEGFKKHITFTKKHTVTHTNIYAHTHIHVCIHAHTLITVHTIQNLHGREWNDETELKDYVHHYRYDGTATSFPHYCFEFIVEFSSSLFFPLTPSLQKTDKISMKMWRLIKQLNLCDEPPESGPIIIGVVLAVILPALISIAGFIMWISDDDGSNPSMAQQHQMQHEV